MSDEPTIPATHMQIPVGTLRVEVLDGADAGKFHVADQETITIGTAEGNDLVLADPTVSRYHLELIREKKGVRVIDHGSTNGTVVAGARIDRGLVSAGTTLKLGNTSIRVAEGKAVDVELLQAETLGRLRGRTSEMRRLMAQVKRAAASDTAVLLVGESGTGKELTAEAIHENSARALGPFVTVDCGSLSPTLVASELFGHEKGAFTGADRLHHGAFERADGGTLFLDEVGELPPALQVNLLGVLERKRFRRVGGQADIPVNVRIVSATNRDLRSEVNAGSFRLDLYYRLAVVVLRTPALRERPDDIPLLFEHFLRECGETRPLGQVVSQSTLEGLKRHRWPGNIRELRNLVEATLAMGETPRLGDTAVGPADPKPAGQDDPLAPLMELPYKDARQSLLNDFEARYLRGLLERTEGNVSRAAREAKMDRSYLIDLLRRHNLK